MVAWLALHFPSHPKTARPSKNPEAGIAHGESLAPAWVTRNVHGSKSTSWREWQPGSAGLQLSPMNHRRSHGLQGNPRDEPGKETPPECPGQAMCFPLDSSQGFGFTPGFFVSPEQFLGAGLISWGRKLFKAFLRVGWGSLGLDVLGGGSGDPQLPLLHPHLQHPKNPLYQIFAKEKCCSFSWHCVISKDEALPSSFP